MVVGFPMTPQVAELLLVESSEEVALVQNLLA
jgi:hypothetical protein